MKRTLLLRLLLVAMILVIFSWVWIWAPRATVAKAAGSFQGVLTYHNDNKRTGWNPSEAKLTLKNVNISMFGKLFVVNADGLVDAQPLYAPNLTIKGVQHNVLFVESENDTAYAFDADNGAPLWHVKTLAPGEVPSDNRGCAQIRPTIGITSTPAIDLEAGPHGTIYMVAMSKDSSADYHQRLHALDVTTGKEQFGGPVEISAKYPGTGENSQDGFVIFDPKNYKERAGLLLLNHVVYTTWASHCDAGLYTGWIIGYDQTTLAQRSVLNVTPNGGGGAIWASGAGPGADSSGNIYVLDANGSFDTTLDPKGFPINGNYGNSILKLSTESHRLVVADYFDAFNTISESQIDEDLGSGGAMVLPNIEDSSGGVHALVVGAGKDRHIYLADRNNLGKFNSENNNQLYQDLTSSLAGGVFSAPAFASQKIFFGAVNDSIKAFAFDAKGKLIPTPQSMTSTIFHYPGATPSISGSTKSNMILWATEHSSPVVLHAYNANDLSVELYNSSQAPHGRDHVGKGNKFVTPTIASGKVYVPTQTGVGVFGLLP